MASSAILHAFGTATHRILGSASLEESYIVRSFDLFLFCMTQVAQRVKNNKYVDIRTTSCESPTVEMFCLHQSLGVSFRECVSHILQFLNHSAKGRIL